MDGKYGSHANGRLYPVSGPGFHALDRGAYKAFGVLNDLGDTAAAMRRMDQMQITKDARDAARTAYDSARRGD